MLLADPWTRKMRKRNYNLQQKIVPKVSFLEANLTCFQKEFKGMGQKKGPLHLNFLTCFWCFFKCKRKVNIKAGILFSDLFCLLCHTPH